MNQTRRYRIVQGMSRNLVTEHCRRTHYDVPFTGNNQIFGSPVNRIRITGYWASRSLTTSPSLNFVERFREYTNYFSFLVATFVIDMAFWTSKINQWIRIRFGMTNEGFEDQLERTMRGFAKSNFGVDIADDAFQG